jgi:hypothetical protein
MLDAHSVAGRHRTRRIARWWNVTLSGNLSLEYGISWHATFVFPSLVFIHSDISTLRLRPH